ncbi:hypothetical protein [Nitrolancea hollandica]|nr:hypothetical protein [Nitrolancea hollandica]
MPLAFFNIDFSSNGYHLNHVALFLAFMVIATLVVAGFSMVTRYRG